MYKDVEDWRKYKRDYNALLKANHLCRNCKRQDGRTLNGFVLCWDCRDRECEKARMRRQDPEFAAAKRADSKARYAERGANGKCPWCGKTPEDRRYKLCAHCRGLKRKSKAKSNQKLHYAANVNWPRGANGYCWTCNKRKAVDGKKLCVECYAKQLESLKKAWAANAERKKHAEYQSGRRRADGEDHRVYH